MPATVERVWRAANNVAFDRSIFRIQENTHMYAFDYQRPGSVNDAKTAFSGGRALSGRRQSLIQAMKLRLSSSERLVDLGGIAELKTTQGRRRQPRDRCDVHARGGRDVGRREARCPALAELARASATRWCATWARSAARLPTPTRRGLSRRARGLRRDRADETSARSPLMRSSPACTRRR